jgi:hypothetical protein
MVSRLGSSAVSVSASSAPVAAASTAPALSVIGFLMLMPAVVSGELRRLLG